MLDAPYLDDLRKDGIGAAIPDFSGGSVLYIGEPEVMPEYTVSVTL